MDLMATLEQKIKYVLEVSDRLVCNDADSEIEICCVLLLTWDESLVTVSIICEEESIANE
jgi:hypothetical protein